MGRLKGASLGLPQALPANIRLGWKGLPVTKHSSSLQTITAVKSFTLQALEENVKKFEI